LIIVAGIGAGSYDTLFNAATVERYGANATKPMTFLHSAAAIGAIVGPPILGQVSAQWHWTTSLHWIGFAHLALTLGAVFVRFPKPAAIRPQHESHVQCVLSTRLLPFAFIAFAYVGVEAGISVFAVPYAADGLDLDPTVGQMGISIFWAGLLAGRTVILAMPRIPGARALIVSGLLGCAALTVGTASGSSHIGIFLGVTGFALGPVYPVMITLVGQRFPQACGAATGLASGAGCIGGFAVPWITGAIGDGVGIGLAIGSLGVWSLAISLGSEGIRRGQAQSHAAQVL
jgi:fucose permease